jgi:hypothetical protein
VPSAGTRAEVPSGARLAECGPGLQQRAGLPVGQAAEPGVRADVAWAEGLAGAEAAVGEERRAAGAGALCLIPASSARKVQVLNVDAQDRLGPAGGAWPDLAAVRFEGAGRQTTQFVRTSAGWKMSAAAWDDE